MNKRDYENRTKIVPIKTIQRQPCRLDAESSLNWKPMLCMNPDMFQWNGSGGNCAGSARVIAEEDFSRLLCRFDNEPNPNFVKITIINYYINKEKKFDFKFMTE